MKLTRAQIVGLYGLAMNLPVDTSIDVLDFDEYGDAIVQAESWSSGQSLRYKLRSHGGTEQLSSADLAR